MSTTHLWIKKQSTLFTKHTGAHRIEPESDGDCVTRFQVWNSRPAPPLDSFAEGVLLCTAQRPTIFSMHLSPHQKLQLGECSPSTADPDSGYTHSLSALPCNGRQQTLQRINACMHVLCIHIQGGAVTTAATAPDSATIVTMHCRATVALSCDPREA